jgi:predicted lactoylglutathione lyase
MPTAKLLILLWITIRNQQVASSILAGGSIDSVTCRSDPTAIHWGFAAENNNKVDEFYEAAMSAGATDNISPRARLEYYPGYYAADVCDPDGYSFEIVHKS